MKLCSEVLVLTESLDTYKKIFAIASNEDVSTVHSAYFEKVESIEDFNIIIAEFPFLRYLTDRRDKVVVLQPGKSFSKLIEAGYERFLFGLDNEDEIKLAMMSNKEVLQKVKVTHKNLVLDFTNNVFTMNGKEIYLTNKDIEYMYIRFVDKDIKRVRNMRVQLYRIRQRLGRNFLKERIK